MTTPCPVEFATSRTEVVLTTESLQRTTAKYEADSLHLDNSHIFMLCCFYSDWPFLVKQHIVASHYSWGNTRISICLHLTVIRMCSGHRMLGSFPGSPMYCKRWKAGLGAGNEANNITCTGHGISRAQGTEYHVHRAQNITCTGHGISRAQVIVHICTTGAVRQGSWSSLAGPSPTVYVRTCCGWFFPWEVSMDTRLSVLLQGM